MTSKPQFLIGATKSGSGKTLITLGILAALHRRGLVVQPFKCGPDFIDPSLHKYIVSRESYNLDIRMMGKRGCLDSYARYSPDCHVTVTEGVMGLFDGGVASSASLARLLDVPVILIVDVRSCAESVAAIVKGFEALDPELNISGIICNRVGSERHKTLIADAVKKYCSSPIIGYIPRNETFTLPSRHLGLHMGHEVEGILDREKLADFIEEHIDLDALLQKTATPAIKAADKANLNSHDTIKLGVALDEAFCFYYPENMDILRKHGIDPVFFSPLHDRKLPDGISGVYLGGGYPELHASGLAANGDMIAAIRKFAEEQGIIYGECGGFMYMCTSLEDNSGIHHGMSGLFPVTVRMKNRLSSLGYREAEFLHDSPLAVKGAKGYGHEFHYSEIVDRPDDLDYLYKLQDGRFEGCQSMNCLGSYVHLHFSRSGHLIQALKKKMSVNNVA